MLKTLAYQALQHFMISFYGSKFTAIAYWIIKLQTLQSYVFQSLTQTRPAH